MMQRAIVAAVIVLGSVVGSAQQVDFPDPNLEAVVREALNTPTGPIYQEAMWQLTSLSAQGRGISDLSGLEHAINLTNLALPSNSINSLFPIAGLTDLATLILWENNISDLSPVGDLINLSVLDIDKNGIDDLTPLQNLIGLTWLDLRENAITILTPLQDLTNLTYLDVSRNNISSLTPLAGMTGLQTLRFSNNSVQNLAPLQNLTFLSTLEAGVNDIVDISPLANLGSLSTLYLGVNNISDVTPLAGLTGLTRLFLHSNNISDLAPLENLVILSELALAFNNITDVASLVANSGLGIGDTLTLIGNPLSQKTLCEDISVLQSRGFATLTVDGTCTSTPVVFNDVNLESVVRTTLDISGTIYDTDMLALTELNGYASQISDLTGLEYAANMERLYLGVNTISDLSPLAGLNNLTRLELFQNNIANLDPLAGLTELTALYLFDNLISEISPLAGLTKLVYLDLSSNTISVLNPLSSLGMLQELALQYNAISDLTGLAGLTNLTDLRLNANAVTNLDALPGLVNLGMLELSDNAISDLAPLVANPGLASGDALYLASNPLSRIALCEQIPVLEARDLQLTYDGVCEIPVLSVQPTRLDLGSAAGTTELTVTNTGTGTIEWDVSVTLGDTWLRAYVAKNFGDGVVTVEYDENPGTVQRVGRIVVVAAEGTENSPFMVPVVQQGLEETAVVFEDPRLEFAVREALGIPADPVHPADLASLVRLNAAGRGIRSLGGLEQAAELRDLNVSYNRLENLDALIGNPDFDEGAALQLYGNPLTQAAICLQIPALAARGVAIGFNGTCGVETRGRIVGFVREDDQPDEPVGCAAVIVYDGVNVLGTVVVDSSGYFEVPGLLLARTYSLVFVSPGHASELRSHTLSQEEADVSVTMRPGPSAILSGIVVDDSAEALPIPAALVVVYRQGREVATTVTCASGAFEIQHVDAAKADVVTLEVSAPGYEDQTVQTDLDTPDLIEVALPKLALYGSIIGSVMDAQGAPMAGADIIVQQVPAGFNAVRLSAADGSYGVLAVPDGEYEARAVMKNVGSGGNFGNVNQDQAQIDIEISHDGTWCTPPPAPAGLAATDGAHADAVVVSWNAVAGEDIEYQVICGTSSSPASAADISGWITATTFRDTAAAPPTTGGSGCNGSTTTYHTYYYWVRARTAGAPCASDNSASDTGYRGEASKTYDTAGSAQDGGWAALALFAAIVLLVPAKKPATEADAPHSGR